MLLSHREITGEELSLPKTKQINAELGHRVILSGSLSLHQGLMNCFCEDANGKHFSLCNLYATSYNLLDFANVT